MTRRPAPRLRRVHAFGLALLLPLGLHALATPRPVQADNCYVAGIDLCAFSDSFSVTYVQTPLMELLWDLNRRALLLSRWLEGLHDWLAEGVLGRALEVVLRTMQFPFWLAAGGAVFVFVVTYLLRLLLVRVEVVHWSRALGVLILALVLFRAGLPGLAAVEQLRLSLVNAFGDIAQEITTAVGAPLFYVQNDGSAAPPHAIYTKDVCGVGVQRAMPGVHVNDLMANYLWAETQDIHCASGNTSLPDLPRAFMQGNGKEFAGYLPNYPLNEADSAERARLMAAANDGTNRLLTALFTLAPAAVLEPLWNLLLLLALSTIALAFLVALPAGLFAPLAPLLQQQMRGLVQVFQVSALSSFWIGLLTGLLRLSAQSGNANAVAISGALTTLVLVWQCVQAAMLAARSLSVGAGAIGVSLGELGRAGSSTAQALGQGTLNTGLIAAAAATGGLGALAGQVLRRGLLTAGKGAAGRSAGRHLVQEIDRWQQQRPDREEKALAGQAAWYDRRLEREDDPAKRARMLERRASTEQAQSQREVRRWERQAASARARGSYGYADKLEAAIAERRAGNPRPEPTRQGENTRRTAQAAPATSASPTTPAPARGPSSPGVAPARRRGGSAAPAPRSRFQPRAATREREQAETARQQRQAQARQEAEARAARQRPTPPAAPAASQPLTPEEVAFFQQAVATSSEPEALDAETFDALLPGGEEDQP